MLEARDLTVVHPARGGRPPARAVDGVNLQVRPGEIVALIGESGCGKSTLARALVGLIPPTSGQVLYQGEPLDPRRMRAFRRRVQLVLQDPGGALNPRQNVFDAVAEGPRLHGEGGGRLRARTGRPPHTEGLPPRDTEDPLPRDNQGLSGREGERRPLRDSESYSLRDSQGFLPRDGQGLSDRDSERRLLGDSERLLGGEGLRERVRGALSKAGLRPPEEFYRRFPHELSGGQQQRVVIAGALALNPSVIVADEPVASLDASVRGEILKLILSLRDELGLSALVVSHDLGLAWNIADRVAVMYLGRIVETGTVEEVLLRPRHPYTRALLSVLPDSPERIVLTGEPPDPTRVPTGCRFHPRCPVRVAGCDTIDLPVLSPADSVACSEVPQ
ncbi:ABC transporter ATP-binding protein [Nonomuraea endophytica]|uniref:Oligopeptide/dipeptide ABC transporter ATP-binding protein n=1 Tax=Nonomuraea endophytica TaxID=714136 RepID=A0A7W8EH91_9ACTN|nr:ABC transporter ATP-binding protein [Nonomuraea endophytica]MBB5078312.1 oligopeptide/dipeptide ABC transporter ATP-binding protein [Nonomuraea endophytica]